MARRKTIDRIHLTLTAEDIREIRAMEKERAEREALPWDRETYEMAFVALASALDAAPILSVEWKAAFLRCFAATFAALATDLAVNRR